MRTATTAFYINRIVFGCEIPLPSCWLVPRARALQRSLQSRDCRAYEGVNTRQPQRMLVDDPHSRSLIRWNGQHWTMQALEDAWEIVVIRGLQSLAPSGHQH